MKSDFELESDEQEFDGLTLEERRNLAKDYVASFFEGKKFCWGGPIPEFLLYADANIKRVLETSISEGVQRIHQKVKGASVPEQILAVLDECAKKWIPKDFAAGIMLMYFDLCKGYPI